MWKFVCSNQSVWHNILQYTWILIQGIPKKCTFKVITKKKQKRHLLSSFFFIFHQFFYVFFSFLLSNFFPSSSFFLILRSSTTFIAIFHFILILQGVPKESFFLIYLVIKKTRKRLLKKFCLLKIKILKNYFLNIMSPKCDPPCSYTFSLRYPHKKNL